MKQTALLLAILMIALTLAACGGTTGDPLTRTDGTKAAVTDGAGHETNGGASGVVDAPALTLQAILQYAETGNTEYFLPRVLNEAERAELRRSVEAEGGTLSFEADGTIRISGEGPSLIVVHPDGSVEGTDADGNPFGFSNKKEWSDSEFGRAVPKADFAIQMQIEDSDGLMILFEGVSYDQVKAYGKQLASAGFTLDQDEIDMKDSGLYSFSAHNEAGYAAELNYMAAEGSVTCALSVAKYQDPSEVTFPDDPYTPPAGSEGDLPSEFAFLLPDGKGDFRVIAYDDYTAIEKAGATLSEAKTFTARCLANGFTLGMESEEPAPDGTDTYLALLTRDDLEIHIVLNVREANKLDVDLLTVQGGDGPELPAGTDPWPLSGPLTRIPKPDFGTGFAIRDDGDVISVAVSGAAASDFAPYMQKLKDAGFTESPDYENDDDVKLYEATDKDGYSAYVQYAYGVFVVAVTTIPE